ncbi:MAG: hypothetical protein GXP62_08075 [Oligoflexia bacterium]|nr:hypothetical protein [Oligoflexia bacterium]
MVVLPIALTALLRPGLDVYDARDETLFHLPTTRAFAAALPTPDLSDYASATTPLYHLMLAPLAAATGGALLPLRLLTLLLALGLLAAVAVLIDHQRAIPTWGAWLALLPLGLSPYFIGPAVRLSTDDAALLWVAAALVVLDRARAKLPALDLGALCIAALLAVAAVLTRQVHGWITGLLFLMPLLATDAAWRKRAIGLALGALPVAALAPLVWCWRGLTPPSFSEHQAGLNPDVLLTELAVLGALGAAQAPWLWSAIGRLAPLASITARGGVLLGCALTGVLILVAHPLPFVADTLHYGGSLWSLSSHLPNLGGTTAAFWVLVPLGLLWCVGIAAEGWHRRDPLPTAALTLFLAANVASARAYQKYYEPFLLIILAWVMSRNKAQRWWWWLGPGLLATAWLLIAVVRFVI